MRFRPRSVRRAVGRPLAGLLVLVAAVTAACSSGATSASSTTTPLAPVSAAPSGASTVPSGSASAAVALSTAMPPWPIPADAAPYIAAAGLVASSEEHVDVHYHAHLDILVNGHAVPVPAGIGFIVQGGQATGLTSLHTHDTSGVVHIESPKNVPFTLGQFFTEWGVALGPGQLGGLTDNASQVLRVFVDGQPFTGNPATIVFRPHQEIALWYGARNAPANVPARYDFPAGE